MVELAKDTGAIDDPLIRERLTRAWAGLQTMRSFALATMDDEQPGGDNVSKLLWANWHRDLGELAMDIKGRTGLVLQDNEFDEWQRLFLFSRADTIYGGSNEIQRNVIAERVLGLPREATRLVTSLAAAPAEIEGHGLLAGKVVVVTAAAGTGIGSATARRALAEGADVMISDHHERRLAETREELAALSLGRVESVVCDVTSTAQVDALISSTTARFGRLDVLVNNAGSGGQTPVVDMTDEEWDRVLNVTLTSVMRATRAALGYFRDADHGGVIVNNASVLGWRAQHSQSHYAAAKAGVMALTRCSAIEAAEYGVRINAVSPSIARHRFLEKTSSTELLDRLSEGEAFGRAAEPWEIAATIAFLASDYSSYLTGEVISVSSQHP